MNKQKFSLKKRIHSFRYAIEGLVAFFKEEHNARIHLVASCIVLSTGFFLKISQMEWIAILFAISIVFITELINTSIERVADYISPEFHPKIKLIKDLAAGAVLVAALFAILVGSLVFIPHCL